jgi:abhydrolase domain-containing protein 12
MSLVSTFFAILVFSSGIWGFLLFLCSFTSVQRLIFYAHKAPISRGQQLDKPETFGYLRNQVASFTIPTSDSQRLYAWLITPLKAYLRHEQDLIAAESPLNTTLKLITNDPAARLVVYFHGNAGTVGQTRRTEAYRSITAGDSDHIYVLAFDYRGFGRSTGHPTEAGLVTDALSILNWAMTTAKIPPENIVLVSQSLGTALATAAIELHANQTPPIEFGGLITCAAFTNAAEVFVNYSLFGTLPLLAPLRYLPSLRRWLTRRMTDSWNTEDRLQSLVAKTKQLRLTMMHATSDEVIPCKMLSTLSDRVVDILRDHGIDDSTEADLGDGGSVHEWKAGERLFRKVLLHHGGHNTIMKWAPVALEVARIFKRTESNWG